MKKALLLLLAILLTLTSVTPSFAEEDYSITDKDIDARGAILINADTGQILFQENAHVQNFPASTTKLLTALIIIEDKNLDDTYTVPYFDYDGQNSSNIAIDKGETFVIRDLLYAMMLESANDAAIALALYHSGSVEAFADVMNKRAKELGALNSNFVNPNGMPDERHVTTAYDLAQIAVAANLNDTLRTVMNTTYYEIPVTNKKNEIRYMKSTNKFLNVDGSEELITYRGKRVPKYYPIVDGMKTGWTPEASNCLISSAKLDGAKVIAVVLGSDDVYLASRKLIDYGLYGFDTHLLYGNDAPVKSLEIDNASHLSVETYAEQPISVMIPKNKNVDDVVSSFETVKPVPAFPIKPGTKLATLTLSLENNELTKVNLVAKREITGLPFLNENLTTYPEPTMFTKSFFMWTGLKLLLGLFLWRVFMVIYYTQKQKQKRKRRR